MVTREMTFLIWPLDREAAMVEDYVNESEMSMREGKERDEEKVRARVVTRVATVNNQCSGRQWKTHREVSLDFASQVYGWLRAQ